MIHQYGWSDALQRRFAEFDAAGFAPGRVIVQQRALWGLVTDDGELRAELSGKFARQAPAGGYPVAGDWVAVRTDPSSASAVIHDVLPRSSAFVRKAAGPAGGEQVVAANADVAFLTASLNSGLNPRRLERYLASAWQSGAAPVVLLTKADLCDDVDRAVDEAQALAVGAPVHAVSALTGEGLDVLQPYLAPGRTAVLLGSSGDGKSTLVNALAGAQRMATQTTREADGRGRHTTSHRELILLPGGGLLLDTPGMRELGLWDTDEGLSATFDDIDALAAACRFSDCGHSNEPGCAIRAALQSGQLEESRWRSYCKLKREIAHLESRDDPALRAARRRHVVQISKANRQRDRIRRRD